MGGEGAEPPTDLAKRGEKGEKGRKRREGAKPPNPNGSERGKKEENADGLLKSLTLKGISHQTGVAV